MSKVTMVQLITEHSMGLIVRYAYAYEGQMSTVDKHADFHSVQVPTQTLGAHQDELGDNQNAAATNILC